MLRCGGRLRGWVLCVRCACDACCRELVWCDWRRAYWSCAEVADWVADAEARRYVIFDGVACFVVFCCFHFVEGGRDFVEMWGSG